MKSIPGAVTQPAPADDAPSHPVLKVGYLVSRFPKITETFVLYEILAVERQGVTVELFPLLRERATVMHPEAAPLVARAHYRPFLSWRFLRAHAFFLRRSWRAYVSALFGLLRGTWGSPRFWIGGLAIFPKTVQFAYEMEDAGVNHVHAHFANHPAAAAWVIHRLTGIPYSFTAHGSDLHRDRHMLAQKVAAAGFVVAISSYNRDVILRDCGEEHRDKVHIIHCGVDTSVFRGEQGVSAHEDRALSVLCVGTLHEVKGQAVLIEACGLLRARGVDVACHLVGDGPDRAALARQARHVGLDERIHFHGRRTRAEVADLIGDAAIVAAPSVPTRNGRREGIPVALMEAMASGVPVVASRLSGIPELVTDGESGLLVTPGDAEGLARALERLAGDRALRRRLGRQARAVVEEAFDLDRNAALLVARFGETAMSIRQVTPTGDSPRLDWRFLLPGPWPGRMAFIGRPDPALVRSLRRSHPDLAILDGPRPTSGGSGSVWDCVVACRPTPTELARAARAGGPDTSFFIETPGPARRWLWQRRSKSALETLGLETRWFWHWPSFERCTSITPLEEPAAVEHTIRRAAGGTGGRIRQAVARWLFRRGLLTSLAPSVSVVARHAARTPGVLSRVHTSPAEPRAPGTASPARPPSSCSTPMDRVLAPHREALGLANGRGSVVFPLLLTPRFRNSSRVIALFLKRNRPDPILVAKLPRNPGDDAGLHREAAVLQRLERFGNGRSRWRWPRIVAFETREGRPVLLETAVRGRVLDRAMVRSEPWRICDAVLDWLVELQLAGRGPTDVTRAGVADWIEKPIARFESVFPCSADERRWIDETRKLVTGMHREGVRPTVEHGDLCPPNLLWMRDDRIGVVDWELGDPDGLPAADFFFFLAFVSQVRSAHAGSAVVAGFHQAFLDPDSPALSRVGRYCERLELPAGALTPIFVGCWFRALAGLVDRLGGSPSLDPETVAWLRGHRFYAWWRHALDHAGELRWPREEGRPPRPRRGVR